MNNAIKLAIEKGGYDLENIQPPLKRWNTDPVITERINLEGADGYWDWFIKNDIILDPLFWQALGKALGWKKYVWLSYGDYRYGSHNNTDFTDDEDFTPPTEFTDTPYAARHITSQYYAHQYLDLVLTSCDTEKFWKELL